MTGAAPSPEIVPALDESRPVVGPNLAVDQEFCKAVMAHIYISFWYPYLLQQQRLWPVWQRIDDAWRVKGQYDDLDVSITDPAKVNKSADGKGKESGMLDKYTGYSAKSQPAAIFKQIKTKTDMHVSIAWADGLPVQAQMPKTMYEHPLYNPTQQSVDVANEMLRQCAEELDIESDDRKVRGSWSKYGHAWVAVDFEKAEEIVPKSIVLPLDQGQAEAILQVAVQKYGGPPRFTRDQFGREVAVWQQRTVKYMRTRYVPLRHDDVFIDQTLCNGDMNRQPCPCVREHVTRFELWGNDYDPDTNQFGWLNVQRALSDNAQQYTLSAQDEWNLRQELEKKWGLSGQGIIEQKNTLKQRWTMYPMLAIYQSPTDGKLMLDKGDGIECPTCDGRQFIGYEHPDTGAAEHADCPECKGLGKLFIKPERYVVQAYGSLGFGQTAATVLRIQRNPTVRDKVPLLYAAHLTEDMSGAVPMCCMEAAMPAWIQLMTAHNQFLDAKNQGINTPFLVHIDSPHKNENLNRPGGNITFDSPMEKPERMQLGTIDVTQNLQNFMVHEENEIQLIGGMTDNLLGMVSTGRRSALETGNAFDAAKMPLTVEIDSCTRQTLGGWAQFHIWNIEAWADRDWLQAKTGRTSFGKVKLNSKVADEFMKKQTLLANTRYVLEASVNDPSMAMGRPALWQQVLELCGIKNASQIANDGGVRKAIMDGMTIVAKICGEGIPLPPDPSDPHEIYVGIFQQALKDPYWQDKTPENLPILFQRLQLQQQLLQAQQLQMLQQQIMQQQIENPPEEGGNGNKPKTPNKPAANRGQQAQQEAGARQG